MGYSLGVRGDFNTITFSKESVGTGNTSQNISHLPIPTLPLPSCWSSNTSKEKDNTTPQGQSPSNIGWKSRLDRFTKTPGLNRQENTDLFGSTPQRGPTSREIKAPTLAVEQILKGTMSRGLKSSRESNNRLSSSVSGLGK
uniref:Putative ovule protein n=1 Tax=Solanum chacoense TaxID=4108 RepID=A0A0V0I6E8_SOLCH